MFQQVLSFTTKSKRKKVSSAIMKSMKEEPRELIEPKYRYIKQCRLFVVLTFCNIPDLSIS